MFRAARYAILTLSLAAACALVGQQAHCAGLDPESNTDGFNPALEAYRVGEARRLSLIARQLDLNNLMLWENPYIVGEPPVRQPLGYESKQIAPNRWIYRPLYAEDMTPADQPPGTELLPAPSGAPKLVPPQAGPQAPAPADAAPGDLIPPPQAPAKPRRAGRQF